jgi:hypothetical protein
MPLEEGCAILHDIHSGICGSHVGARMLVGKTYRHGFYWPTTDSDADSLVHRCKSAVDHSNKLNMDSHTSP